MFGAPTPRSPLKLSKKLAGTFPPVQAEVPDDHANSADKLSVYSDIPRTPTRRYADPPTRFPRCDGQQSDNDNEDYSSGETKFRTITRIAPISCQSTATFADTPIRRPADTFPPGAVPPVRRSGIENDNDDYSLRRDEVPDDHANSANKLSVYSDIPRTPTRRHADTPTRFPRCADTFQPRFRKWKLTILIWYT